MEIDYRWKGLPVVVMRDIPSGSVVEMAPCFYHPHGYIAVGEGTDMDDFLFKMNCNSVFDRKFLEALHIAR